MGPVEGLGNGPVEGNGLVEGFMVGEHCIVSNPSLFDEGLAK
jgi:hypothetical protein